MFSSIPSVVVREIERSRRNHLIAKSLKGWCDRRNFGSYDHGAVYSVPSLLVADATHLDKKKLWPRICLGLLTGL